MVGIVPSAHDVPSDGGDWIVEGVPLSDSSDGVLAGDGMWLSVACPVWGAAENSK